VLKFRKYRVRRFGNFLEFIIEKYSYGEQFSPRNVKNFSSYDNFHRAGTGLRIVYILLKGFARTIRGQILTLR
jgi:hypothetical protein